MEISIQESKKLAMLYPPVAQMVRALLARARTSGLDVVLWSTFRSFEEQQAIFNKRDGSTQAKAGFSWHNYGLAADVLFNNGKGGPSWGATHPWEKLGVIGEALGFEWGGRWKMRDMGHFQNNYGLKLADCARAFRAGGIPMVWALIPKGEEREHGTDTGSMSATDDEHGLGDDLVGNRPRSRRRRR